MTSRLKLNLDAQTAGKWSVGTRGAVWTDMASPSRRHVGEIARSPEVIDWESGFYHELYWILKMLTEFYLEIQYFNFD